MPTPDDHLVTRLLDRVNAGDDAATSELLNVTYRDLRALAAVVFQSESPGHTLQPTAVVNEVCVRLMKAAPRADGWTDRSHFFKTAARAMRNILKDHARAKKAVRRGGGAGRRVTLDSIEDPVQAGAGIDLIALDEVLEKLAAHDARLGTVFELRYLAGLSIEQTAAVTGYSPRSVERDCTFIRAWLRRELYS
ncbi:MAG: sigma-70 family RNA polymerase sigma factor [Planctomycetes bacterium]|nr:sigma-70 family RNA polymerase sigma factor [Planctomycetota bacterium]